MRHAAWIIGLISVDSTNREPLLKHKKDCKMQPFRVEYIILQNCNGC